MNLEDQVCSLKLAKRLKELGVKQQSLVHWLNIQHCVHMKVKEDGYTLQEDENGQPMIDRIDYRQELGNPYAYNIDKDNTWSAFTVAELGEMLPDWQETVKRANKDWVCIVRHKHNDTNDHSFAETEANARAKMLIYLIENGFIKNEKDFALKTYE